LDEENTSATKRAQREVGINFREETEARELEKQRRDSTSEVQQVRSERIEQRRRPEYFWDRLRGKNAHEEARLPSKAAKSKVIRVSESDKSQG